MAWSIFQQGGGQASAVAWARDLLGALGAPLTPGNEQFVYDWELAEGGGGAYNPLNQGPVPGQPQLTTTGSQYGGGAADYASWGAGLQGAFDYLHMPLYRAVLQDLQAGAPAATTAAALEASPWAASHYGYGANWPNTAVPSSPSGAVGATLASYGGDFKNWLKGGGLQPGGNTQPNPGPGSTDPLGPGGPVGSVGSGIAGGFASALAAPFVALLQVGLDAIRALAHNLGEWARANIVELAAAGAVLLVVAS